MSKLQQAEWDQWRQICQTLLAAGAVTEADLRSPRGSDDTPGQKLISDIRFWGDLRARQGKEQPRKRLPAAFVPGLPREKSNP